MGRSPAKAKQFLGVLRALMQLAIAKGLTCTPKNFFVFGRSFRAKVLARLPMNSLDPRQDAKQHGCDGSLPPNAFLDLVSSGCGSVI